MTEGAPEQRPDAVPDAAHDPEEPAPAPGPGLFRRTFHALTTRNYRLFYIGQSVSAIGTWMQRVAQDWLILELGGGPVQLAIGLALQSGPVLLLSMWGGVITDRYDTRKVLLVSQVSFAILALALGLLVLTDRATLPIVYAMAFLLGITNVLDKPARHAFVLELVGAEGAANAVSLNSSINNGARLIGPAVAGVVITLSGIGVAFLLNAATFVAIIMALLLMDPTAFHPREFAPPGRGQVIEGIRSSMGRVDLRTPLVATFVLSTLSQNFRLTLPLMASEVFGRGVGGYGLLMSALGVGALFGALLCANLARPSQRMAGMAALGFGMLLLLAAAAPTYLALAAIVVGMGVGSTAFNATSHTLLLLRSDVDKRGRVMAVRELFSNGLTPLGSLGIGWVCAVTSPRLGMAVGGVAAIGAALLMFRDPPAVRSGALVPDASG